MIVDLQPLVQTKDTEQLKLSVDLQIANGIFQLKYILSGAVERVAVPAISAAPSKKEGLWNNTCFEIFISREGSPKYIEWNFSPTHDWCLLFYEDYRKAPSKDVPKVSALPKIISRRGKKEFSLDARFDLNECTNIWAESTPYEIGLASVLEHSKGDRSFWAITHVATHPDFHLRRSFVMKA